MCHVCVLKNELRVQLLRLMSVNPKPSEHVAFMFSVMENLHIAIRMAIEDGSFEIRGADGELIEATPEMVEPIVVSETTMMAMYGIQHPDELMASRTMTIVGNMMLAFSIALAWIDEDESMTPREAFEKHIGDRLDSLSEADDTEARASAVDQVNEMLREAQRHVDAGVYADDSYDEEGFPRKDGDLSESMSDEDVSAAVDKFLEGIE
jgi:hypothetical protein